MLGDEKQETAAAFCICAAAFFATHGVFVKVAFTDNGVCYRSEPWQLRFHRSSPAGPAPSGH
jgi:hypothetical protein